jgi:hypothetical protein
LHRDLGAQSSVGIGTTHHVELDAKQALVGKIDEGELEHTIGATLDSIQSRKLVSASFSFFQHALGARKLRRELL